MNFDTSEKATSLQFVSKPIVSAQTCNRLHSDPITEDMICAGFTQGGADACIGDSGGPLVLISDVKNSVDNGGSSSGGSSGIASEGAVLVGVVSWGVKCADIYPGVYSKVAHSRDWVDEALSDVVFVGEGRTERKRRRRRRGLGNENSTTLFHNVTSSQETNVTNTTKHDAVNNNDGNEGDDYDGGRIGRGSAGNRVTRFDWAKCSNYLTRRQARVERPVDTNQTTMTMPMQMPTTLPVESSTSSLAASSLQAWIGLLLCFCLHGFIL